MGSSPYARNHDHDPRYPLRALIWDLQNYNVWPTQPKTTCLCLCRRGSIAPRFQPRSADEASSSPAFSLRFSSLAVASRACRSSQEFRIAALLRRRPSHDLTWWLIRGLAWRLQSQGRPLQEPQRITSLRTPQVKCGEPDPRLPRRARLARLFVSFPFSEHDYGTVKRRARYVILEPLR
jgi:hypothetical protein